MKQTKLVQLVISVSSLEAGLFLQYQHITQKKQLHSAKKIAGPCPNKKNNVKKSWKIFLTRPTFAIFCLAWDDRIIPVSAWQ